MLETKYRNNLLTSTGGGKNLTISMIRLLAMLSIIACHFCQYYNNEWAWWLNVGVQMFFIISGYLYGNRSVENPVQWLRKRFLKILIPYYIFLTLAIIGYTIVSPDILGAGNIVSSYLVVGTIKGISHLWFVSYILFCYIITPYLAALRDYLSNKNLLFSIGSIVVIFGVYSIIEILINGYFRPGRVGCYILGYFTAVLVNRIGTKSLLLCFWISLIPTVISNYVYCHIHYLQGLEMKGTLVHITDFSHAFLGYSLTMLLMLVFIKIKGSRILDYSDKYSYEIYLVHQLFILSPLTLLTTTNNSIINVSLTIFVIFLSGYILNKLQNTLLSASRR